MSQYTKLKLLYKLIAKDAILKFLTRVVSHMGDSIRAETENTFTLFTPKWFLPSVSLHMYNNVIPLSHYKLAKAGYTLILAYTEGEINSS